MDEALQKLAGSDPEKAKLVELRYFAGLTGEQAAEVHGTAGGGPNATWANLGVPLAYSGARYETGLPCSAAIRISA